MWCGGAGVGASLLDFDAFFNHSSCFRLSFFHLFAHPMMILVFSLGGLNLVNNSQSLFDYLWFYKICRRGGSQSAPFGG